MDIKLVDLVTLHNRLKPEIDAELEKVFATSAFINGPTVGELEAALADYLDVKYAIGCASGTDALVVALRGLGIQAGDEVLTTPFTFAATIEAILLVGATPIYADIDPKTLNLDTLKLESAITPKTKAILPVHLYGQGCNMTAIMAFAAKHHLFVLEDNAQAFGASYGEKKLGTFGHASATSFFPAKNLGAFGDAGGIFTNDEALYQKMKMIAQHGSKLRYHHEVLGLNSRLDTLQAAVLKVKLNYLNDFNAARQKAAAWYDAFLADANLQTPQRDKAGSHIYHQYTILVENPGQRDALQQFLKEQGVPSAVHYPVPTHLQPAFADEKYPKGSLPVAESVAERVLSLPMHTELTEAEVAFVCEKIIAFVGKR
ncbi:DegT/DnrJ/EryC1/StrS aminotransferase [Chloroherpeton thalassium ATCC 35110]|uniref:DegT/DnrJ/EryC1/StrS aminotransferase n=1 Tax=Chloroherpeton thalassium (strain ATCC 35110 / GB-78) TaxID=517418 RepID=B3QV87_CHLT3|nr:DegT/DnrJ/EryC1/StrS family aminotransferase [Chloroherpeton thalassium]ACF13041.1 DegT/DnrJ/EryC1/StrS aminotransferase [Chloroherpeton thalassium ATCC 35110]